MPVGELETPYKERPAGSASKLRTYVDGFAILAPIVVLVKEERPLQFFSLAALALLLLALAIGLPVVVTFLEPAWCRVSRPPSSPPRWC